MDEIVLMTNLAVFLLVASICSIIFNKLKLPPLIGYLMAGIIIANVWTMDEDSESIVEILSDMGLITLMFCIGMEINLKKIRKQGTLAIIVALVQLPLMVLGGVVVGTLMGFNIVQSICLGGIISGSSTAVVMAVLKTQNRLDKDHIDTIVLITIMEDIGQVIILSMITPMMAGSELDSNGLIAMIISIAVFMLVSIIVGLRFMPRIINWVSDNVHYEVLLILAIGSAFGMALLAQFAGLSVAIGAFLLGMMISPSRKSRELSHDFEPMKNLLMSMFFISVGMEISVQSLLDNVVLILVLYLIYAFLKSSTVFLGYWLGNEAPRNGFISAVSLVAMGEFAFIISKQALDYGVVDEAFYTSVIGAALISMITLPILSRSSGDVWDKAIEACPAGLMGVFKRIKDARDNLYANVAASSRRTRKQFRKLMTMNYVCVLAVILVEIVFVLINPALAGWFAEYIGGTILIWSILMLLMNLFGIYFPIYVIVNNLRMARAISDKGSNTIHVNQEGLSILDMFRVSSTTMLSMMIAITILIVVPNNLGIWEHIVVMILALLGLFYYNRKTIQKMFEAQVTSVDSDSNQHLDGAANTSDEHQDQNRSEVVSINLNDRKLE
ncbi:MAG: cation:proton antiporter [Candidatus Methanomethylophilaceae archaeon]|nr:cation:proton antiporter [Candidatus Methanomethylophilaceae archaeon]